MSEELNDYNPKKDRVKTTKQPFTFRLADIVQDPVGIEIKDPQKIRDMYKRWPLIPYAGTVWESNDGLLLFFDSTKFVSPTQGACHNSIKSFLFGKKIHIRYSENSDFDIDDEREDVPETLKREYAEFIGDIITDSGSIKKAACDFYDEMASNGNIFVELVHTQTAGERQSAFYHHPTQHCKYWATLKGEAKAVMISEIFTEDYFRRNPPRVIPVYPNYVQEPDGTQRTIIHIKNGNFKYYGRPMYAGAWIDIFSEAKERHYLTKIAANNFTGQGVMEVEDDDIESGINVDNEQAIEQGYEGIAERFDMNFTAKSDDPQTWLFMSRPKGARPVFIYEFKINTSEGFYKTVGAMHRQAIIENNNWSERLLGNAVSEGFSTDSFVSELKTKEISTLSFYRDYVVECLDLIFTKAALWAGRNDLAELGIYFPTAVDEVSKIKNAEFKDLLTAYGTAVRAGAITSTEADEEYFRMRLGIMPANENVQEAWREDGGYRRPVTLKTDEQSPAQQTLTE